MLNSNSVWHLHQPISKTDLHVAIYKINDGMAIPKLDTNTSIHTMAEVGKIWQITCWRGTKSSAKWPGMNMDGIYKLNWWTCITIAKTCNPSEEFELTANSQWANTKTHASLFWGHSSGSQQTLQLSSHCELVVSPLWVYNSLRGKILATPLEKPNHCPTDVTF